MWFPQLGNGESEKGSGNGELTLTAGLQFIALSGKKKKKKKKKSMMKNGDAFGVLMRCHFGGVCDGT